MSVGVRTLNPPVARNVELGYAQKTTDTTTTLSSYTDVAGLSITVTVGDRPIMLRAYCHSARHSAAGGLAVMQVAEGATGHAFGQHTSSGANEIDGVLAEKRLAPTAGVHTYKVQIAISAFGTAGTATFGASADAPMFLQAVEI